VHPAHLCTAPTKKEISNNIWKFENYFVYLYHTKTLSTMAKKLTVEEVLADEGLTLMDVAFSSVVPACCSEGCQVEPDGHCPHGNESVLLAEGLI
jgi:hypothetical protein